MTGALLVTFLVITAVLAMVGWGFILSTLFRSGRR